MPAAQQRTRNRRRIDPGQAPIPVLFVCQEARPVNATTVDFFFSVPIRLLGIPPIRTVGGLTPTSATQTAENVVRCIWASDSEPGQILTFPDWTPALRGLNGEWVSGVAMPVGGGLQGQFPTVVPITEVQRVNATQAIWTFASPMALTDPDVFKIDTSPADSVAQEGTNAIRATYSFDPAGLIWSMGAWETGSYNYANQTWASAGQGPVV